MPHGRSVRGRAVECRRDACPPRRPEVRRLVRRRRRPHQAGRAPDRPRARAPATTSSSSSRRWATPPTSCSASPPRSPTSPTRASSTCCSPPASTRRRRCCRWPSTALGSPAISLTGPQAGITTDGRYGRARIAGIEPRRVREELEAGKVVIVAGFQGQSTAAPTRDHDARPRRQRHDRGRPRRRAARRALPDLHRRPRHLHRGSAARPEGAPAAGHRLRGDARARPPGRPGHAGPRGRARLGQRRRHRGPQLVRGRPGHAHQGGPARGAAQQGPRARPRPERRQGHRSSPCRTGRASPGRSSSRWPRPASTST